MAKKKEATPAVSTGAGGGAGNEGGGGEGVDDLARRIARILDECRLSHAVHNRKLRELSAIRSSSPAQFLPCFVRALTPLFDASRRTASSERVVRFVSAFSTYRGDKAGESADSDEFLEGILKFLLLAAGAAHKTARFRSCQIISEIIMRLPDDADVSDDVWDEVIDCLKQRVQDKVPAVRAFAVRALSRFFNDAENTDVLDLLLEILPVESNTEVRKTIVLSLPPTTTTSTAIINRTLDVSESVRKAVYCALASKFPLQSLSIKQRTTVLQRGLADRSSFVKRECLKMLREEWLTKCCNGDLISLLRLLDVETYETVGEAVMRALLEDGIVDVQEGQSIRQMVVPTHDQTEGQSASNVILMEPEFALYWRILCKHLQSEAQAKGSDAATTMGAEAAVYASQASMSNDLLEDVLPETISDYVELVRAHLGAGSNYRFATRQLLLLGAMLDFSDITNRKIASILVREMLHHPLEHEIDDEGNEIVIGDGISFGGDRDWAKAVAELAKKVHASAGEFEEVVIVVIEELARPCRERSATPLQWMHCLAVTGLLLENVDSIWCLKGKAIEPTELLQSLLLSGAKHIHIDVQRVAISCLCLFGLLERKPSEDLVKQLRLSFIAGPSPVSIMACKALFDLASWHGPHEVDKAILLDQSQLEEQKNSFISVDLNEKEDSNVGVLDLLFAGFDSKWVHDSESDDQETVQSVIGEGFAKIILLSENYPSISTSLHPLILAKLIGLYFTSEKEDLERLKQCLSVFFEHYPALSINHKKCLSRAFIPVIRSMWPGIYGNAGGSSHLISKMRKRATQAAQFMLQMMQTPLIQIEPQEGQSSEKSPEDTLPKTEPSLDITSGEEGLAIRIAAEVLCCPSKKTAAGKSYISALSKTVVLLNFRSSEQDAIKCMCGLLNCMADSVSADREASKEIMRMTSHLKTLDEHPDEELPHERAKDVLGKLELDIDIESLNTSRPIPPTPAAPRSTRPAPKRRVRREASSSSEEDSPVKTIPETPVMIGTRSQRASKTVAMSRMTAKAAPPILETDDEEGSDVTSEEDTDESSDEFAE